MLKLKYSTPALRFLNLEVNWSIVSCSFKDWCKSFWYKTADIWTWMPLILTVLEPLNTWFWSPWKCSSVIFSLNSQNHFEYYWHWVTVWWHCWQTEQQRTLWTLPACCLLTVARGRVLSNAADITFGCDQYQVCSRVVVVGSISSVLQSINHGAHFGKASLCWSNLGHKTPENWRPQQLASPPLSSP